LRRREENEIKSRRNIWIKVKKKSVESTLNSEIFSSIYSNQTMGKTTTSGTANST